MKATPEFKPTLPPDFEQARNRKQKQRAAGLSPDYWYAIGYDSAVKKGQIVEIKFWKKSYALFRGEDGMLRMVDNRCAHRQVKLTLGEVKGCNIACTYHGWCYDGEGKVVDIPHELFGRAMPKFRVGGYPIKVRYGLIWAFFGDAALAQKRHIPDIPELEGPERWACVPIDYTWKCHHSMIVDNVCDFTHAYLHRKTKPFVGSKLTRCEAVGDKVFVSYETKVGMGPVTRFMVDRKQVNTNSMDLCYEYPYQWSSTDNKIKHWCFVLPIDERTTQAFFLFYFESLKVPFLPIHIPRQLMSAVLTLANPLFIRPILEEDGVAVESEQEGYEAHFDAPIAELNPVVGLFQQLTIRKWEEHLGINQSPDLKAEGKAEGKSESKPDMKLNQEEGRSMSLPLLLPVVPS